VLEGIAYVQQGVSSSAAVFIPITCPCILSKGPPELPSAIAASVTIAFNIGGSSSSSPSSSSKSRTLTPTLLTTPLVSRLEKDCSSRNG